MEFPLQIDSNIVKVEERLAQAYSEALDASLSDPDWVARTKASGPFTENIKTTAAPMEFFEHDNSLRKGLWSFAIHNGGPAWRMQIRMPPGSPTRITLIAPLIFYDKRWVVQDLLVQKTK